MVKYIVKEGKWKDLFNFKLPDLIYSRTKSHTLVHSVEYPPDKKVDLPTSILEIHAYNPMAYKNQKVFKAKLWFDKDGRINKLKPENYLKYSEYSFELDDILYEIGEEIKLTTLRDRTTLIKIKKSNDFSFDIIFSHLKSKLKENIPFIENWLSEHLKEKQVKINDYITLELKEELYKVYCKGEYFWTFIQDDIRRSRPLKLKMNFEEWFRDSYLSYADDKYHPQKLEFSDTCELFRRWNDNNLKNLDFKWHFYGHLMGRLQNAGHQGTKKIYDGEIKKRDEEYLKILNDKKRERLIQKGIWNDFFDFEIPEQELRELELQTSSWMEFPYDVEKMVPRSILDITIYKAQNLSDRWFKVKWYLERNDEMREIQYERGTYFKYWEFEEKKKEILRNLGEEIELITHLDGSTSISFSNPNFVSKEVIFPEFRKQLNQLLNKI